MKFLFIIPLVSLVALVPAHAQQKELLLPDSIWKVPPGNDFEDNASQYSLQRMVSSPNMAVFWAKEYGDDPVNNPDSTRRFYLEEVLSELERFYDAYVNQLQFVVKGHSVSDRYKALLFVIDGDGGTAFGGGEGDVGVLWTPPARMNHGPYGALAHELGHSFQYLVHADGSWGFTSAPVGSHGQSIFEMTSQFMLWQVEPEWMTFENYHLQAFMKQTHYAFLHEINMYHSPYVLEYWAEKHGAPFIGRLWRDALEGEDPVMAYKRLTGINQSTFNDEIFDAYRHFITWDLARVQEMARPYRNQHLTVLDATANGRYRIPESQCPQNYGYNGIQLTVPAAGSEVTVHFKGRAGADGYRAIRTEKAGWRYGFVAYQTGGARVYSPIYSRSNGKATFTVPENTEYLWLVVSGAPSEHWEHLLDGEDANDEQWPYEFRLRGTSPVVK